MGRIVAQVSIANALDPSRELRCDALVDTSTSSLVLLKAWRERLGTFSSAWKVALETGDQRMVSGEVCGPVRIEIEGFRPIFSEVTFVEMQPREGRFEPLLGYLILQQSQAAVDPVGHRLIPVKAMDLK